MKFSFACSVLAPVVVVGGSKVVRPFSPLDDDNSNNNIKESSLPSSSSSSSYSITKKTDVFKRLAERLEFRYQPNKIRNGEDVVVVDEKEEKATVVAAAAKEECAPPVTLSKTKKIDLGELPLSSCSSDKQICVNRNSMKQSSSSSSSSSSSMRKKTGICVEIDHIPSSYWTTGDPNAKLYGDVPGSYWQEASASSNNAAAIPLSEDDDEQHQQRSLQSFNCPGYFYGKCNITVPSERPKVNVEGEDLQMVIDKCVNDGVDCPYNVAINCWDVSSVTDMEYAFNNQTDFNEELYCWDTSSVTTMYTMFGNATEFNKRLDRWNTAKVEDFNSMFYGAEKFDKSLSSWDTSSAMDMSYMFGLANRFDQAIGSWNTANVVNMTMMFYYATQFNQPVNDWNTGKVTEMMQIFYDASFFNQPLGDWDVSKIENFRFMFGNAEYFDQDINKWDVSRATSMAGMFYDCGIYQQSFNNWDTSGVTSMRSMFESSYFSGKINELDTSNVNNMASMFFYSDWGYSTIYYDLDQTNINGWDTSKVTTMASMFGITYYMYGNPLEDWDVSKVEDMYGMFFNSSFDMPIDKWNVVNLQNASYMFEYTDFFNECLATWAGKTSDTVNTTNMFNYTICPSYVKYGIGTPLPDQAPWCQNEADGCFAPSEAPSTIPSSVPSIVSSSVPTIVERDECANNPNFAVEKKGKVKNCEGFLKKNSKPLTGNKLKDKCKKGVDTTTLGKVRPKDECPGTCNIDCVCRDVPNFLAANGDDCNALFEGKDTLKKQKKTCDEKVQPQGGGDREKISKFCGRCKKQCNCLDDLSVSFVVDKDAGIKKNCVELLGGLKQKELENKCKKKYGEKKNKKKPSKYCPSFCNKRCSA